MRRAFLIASALAFTAATARADDPKKPDAEKTPPPAEDVFKPEEVTTSGSVEGLDYSAAAGTLVVHPKGWDDVKDKENKDNPAAVASMFYVAYFKKGAPAAGRPITFLYNGGPGSSTVWLHMGAFGPKRVVTADDTHSPAAPYRVIDNEYTLLDASDMVFIDAPGTGFGHLRGADKEKAFYGIDQDAHAFANFIVAFLSHHNRWNSPKYLFGESYGTTRSAALANILQSEKSLDLNGIVLLSQILNFDDSVDGPQFNQIGRASCRE